MICNLPGVVLKKVGRLWNEVYVLLISRTTIELGGKVLQGHLADKYNETEMDF